MRSTQFVDFLCKKVVPAYGILDVGAQTQILKLLAEVCMFTGSIQQPLQPTQKVYELLMVRKKVQYFLKVCYLQNVWHVW